MMASNHKVDRDITLGGGTFVAVCLRRVDGLDDVERKPCLLAVCVEVLGEDGITQVVTVPHEPASPRGIPVEGLAKRLNTTPDRIFV